MGTSSKEIFTGLSDKTAMKNTLAANFQLIYDRAC